MQKRGSYYEITTGGWHGENVILSPRVVSIRDAKTDKKVAKRLFRKWYGRDSARISVRMVSGVSIVTAYDDCLGDWLRIEPIIWPMTVHSLIHQRNSDIFVRRKIRGYPGLSGFSSWQMMLRRGLR